MEVFSEFKMEKNQTENIIQNINVTVDALQKCNDDAVDNKTETGFLVADFLAGVQEMESNDVTLDVVKMSIFDANKWNYKVDDASTGATRSVNFGKGCKAPSVISVLFSQGKKYNSKGYMFADAITWQDVVTGGKDDDPLIAIREACKDLIKAAKGVSPTEVEYLAGQINANREALEDRKNGLRIAA